MQDDRAVQLLAQGHMCSESVLLAVCEEHGMEQEGSVIPRIAYGFGGGIGCTGAVCGAVVGAVMALSLKLEPAETQQNKLRHLAKAGELRRRFEAEMGTISCRELTGLDLSTETGFEDLMKSDVVQKVCAKAVNSAYHIVMNMLDEPPIRPESSNEAASIRVTSLCGQNAVQIWNLQATGNSFVDLKERLSAMDPLEVDDHMIRMPVGEQELVVYYDGRTIVRGTRDEKLARSLYEKYVGM